MAKLNTKDIKSQSEAGGTPKTLQPGNTTCTINSVRLEEFKFIAGGYHIILNLEGPDLGSDFDGFFIDKNNEKLGKFKGQVADVRASEYAFADGKTKSGISVDRDTEILKFLKSLCTALDINKWLDAQDDKHDTIESLINAFDKEKPYKGIAIDYCLAGKEYMNKNGYIAHQLFLPKFTKAGSPYGSNVVKFNTTNHIKKKQPSETVSDFGSSSSSSAVNTDFQLDD